MNFPMHIRSLINGSRITWLCYFRAREHQLRSQGALIPTLSDSFSTTDGPHKYNDFLGVKLSDRKEFKGLMSHRWSKNI